MGADRKGPLAAFIVVAIIAAVLLVTSVRSQAAPGWLDPDKLPATVVAGPATEPHLWGSITGGVHQVVQDGVVLARRAAADSADGDDPTTTSSVGPSASVVATPAAVEPATPVVHQVAGTHTHRVTTGPHHQTLAPHRPGPVHRHHAPQRPAPTAPSAPATPGADPVASPDTHDHGRHLGWTHGHGHDGTAGMRHGNSHRHAHGRGR